VSSADGPSRLRRLRKLLADDQAGLMRRFLESLPDNLDDLAALARRSDVDSRGAEGRSGTDELGDAEPENHRPASSSSGPVPGVPLPAGPDASRAIQPESDTNRNSEARAREAMSAHAADVTDPKVPEAVALPEAQSRATRPDRRDLAIQCTIEMGWHKVREWLMAQRDRSEADPVGDSAAHTMPEDVISISAVVIASKTWMTQQSSWTAGRTYETVILASTIFYCGAYETWPGVWNGGAFSMENIREAAEQLRDWIARVLELQGRIEVVSADCYDSALHEWQGGQSGGDRILPASFSIRPDPRTGGASTLALVRPYDPALIHGARGGA
jgi:hypothetical protein